MHRAAKSRYRFPLTRRHKAKDSSQTNQCEVKVPFESLGFSPGPNPLSTPITPPDPYPLHPLSHAPQEARGQEKRFTGGQEMWSIHIGPEGKEPVTVETKQKVFFKKSMLGMISLLSVSPCRANSEASLAFPNLQNLRYN